MDAGKYIQDIDTREIINLCMIHTLKSNVFLVMDGIGKETAVYLGKGNENYLFGLRFGKIGGLLQHFISLREGNLELYHKNNFKCYFFTPGGLTVIKQL